MQNKRRLVILLITGILLLIPLVAMQFTEEVHWTLSDFIVGGALLFGTGLIIDLIVRNIKNTTYRYILAIIALIVLILIWIELAVGIF